MATYYLTITPIDTLSTSTYSIYFDSITPSNLIASGIDQSVLTGAGYSVNDTGRISVIVKNEDPDCCCDAQIFTFPTPSPTPSPTPNPTPTPTTPSPTPNPTPNPTPTPTTPVPTPNPTPNPTTPNPTPTPVAECGTFGEFTKISGGGELFITTVYAGSSGVGGTTVATGTITTTGNNCSISIRAFSGTGGSTSQGQLSVNTVGTVTTTTAGPGGGIYTTTSIVIPLAGTYDITLSGIFIAGTNPPTNANSVYLFIT